MLIWKLVRSAGGRLVANKASGQSGKSSAGRAFRGLFGTGALADPGDNGSVGSCPDALYGSLRNSLCLRGLGHLDKPQVEAYGRIR